MELFLFTILILSSAFTIPAEYVTFKGTPFYKVAGRLNIINTEMYSLSTPFFCASQCKLSNSTCFGFNYNGSVCEIITSFNESQQVTAELGYNYYSEICPIKKTCENGGTSIETHSSFCGESKCTCRGPKAAPDKKYYGGQWCEKVCSYTEDKKKDMDGGDLYIQKNITNVEVCLQVCAENLECQGIQYNINIRCIYKIKSNSLATSHL